MSYRYKIGLLEKQTYKTIKDMSYQEIAQWFHKDKYEKEDDYVPIYKLTKEIYELGKNCDMTHLKPCIKPVFSNKNTHKKFNDENEFVIIGKEGLLLIIEDYRKTIVQYLKSNLNPSNEDKIFFPNKNPVGYLEGKIKEWEENVDKFKLTPYNLDLKSDTIVSSWSYEYAIFELVRLYKTIDDEKYIITLNAW